MLNSTPGIDQFLDIADWRNHFFGLPRPRWEFLAGKTFWVTGAGSGYGRAIALALAAADATIYLTGRRQTLLDAVSDEAPRYGIDATLLKPLVADIADPKSVVAAANFISRDSGKLFGLINNAAISQTGTRYPLLTGDWASWRNLLSINLDGQWWVCRNAIPLMVRNNGGRVVFMSSEAGWAFTAGFGAYNVSKCAMNNLASSMAAECEVAHAGIDLQINTLVPGEARTEMNQGSDFSPFSVVPMVLALVSHPFGGPNGHYFHRDGRHLSFAYAESYGNSLFKDYMVGALPQTPGRRSWINGLKWFRRQRCD